MYLTIYLPDDPFVTGILGFVAALLLFKLATFIYQQIPLIG